MVSGARREARPTGFDGGITAVDVIIGAQSRRLTARCSYYPGYAVKRWGGFCRLQDVVRYAQRLQEESPKAVLDSMFRLPKTKQITTSLLVLGADCDGNVTPNEVRATARAYRTEAEFFPDMGHNMMLEPGWAGVAQRIHTWLGAHEL